MTRLARILFGIAALVAAASLVATLAWVFVTIGARSLDGVEGDVLFEADRIRSGLPLYVDPRTGALDYGPPPARYLVLYAPLWPAFLAILPRSVVLARSVAIASWFGVLAMIVWRAPKERRLVVGSAAVFVAGLWILALYGAMARPDALALLFTGLALERAARRGRIDLLCGVLFGVAAWVKPNVIGAAPGAFVAVLLLERRIRALVPGAVGVALACALIGGVLQLVSRGLWLQHLLASTGQPPDLGLWLRQTKERGPFFVPPLLGTLALGLHALRRARDPGVAIATGALATSILWCFTSLAKIGSASNYFLEPSIAMLVVLSRVDLPRLGARARALFAALVLTECLWTGVASIAAAAAQIPRAFVRQRALGEVRTICGAAKEAVVIADEPGIELTMNGRIVATPYQSTHLARRGAFPLEEWIDDVQRPEVQCLVTQDDLLERPLSDVRVAHDRFGPALRETLLARFALVRVEGGLHVYRVR